MQQSPDEFDAFYKARPRAPARSRPTRSPVTSPPRAAQSATRSSPRGTTGARSPAWRTPRTGSGRTPGSTRSAGTPPGSGTATRASTPTSRATLDALAKLSMTQRKVLLLTQLSSVAWHEMAREVGLTRRAPPSGSSRPRPRAVRHSPRRPLDRGPRAPDRADRPGRRLPLPPPLDHPSRRAPPGAARTPWPASPPPSPRCSSAAPWSHESGGVAPDLHGDQRPRARRVTESAGSRRAAATRGPAERRSRSPSCPAPAPSARAGPSTTPRATASLDLPAGPLRRPRRASGPWSGPSHATAARPADDGHARPSSCRRTDRAAQARLRPHRRLVRRLPRRPGAAARPARA